MTPEELARAELLWEIGWVIAVLAVIGLMVLATRLHEFATREGRPKAGGEGSDEQSVGSGGEGV